MTNKYVFLKTSFWACVNINITIAIVLSKRGPPFHFNYTNYFNIIGKLAFLCLIFHPSEVKTKIITFRWPHPIHTGQYLDTQSELPRITRPVTNVLFKQPWTLASATRSAPTERILQLSYEKKLQVFDRWGRQSLCYKLFALVVCLFKVCSLLESMGEFV